MIMVATSFLIVVALAFYMYVSTQKHSVAVVENNKLHEIVVKNHEELKQELESLKTHIHTTDSIYHKPQN